MRGQGTPSFPIYFLNMKKIEKKIHFKIHYVMSKSVVYGSLTGYIAYLELK